ncbi:MAG: nucleoside hydrolase [Maioricimonas sp. JB049]
MPEKLIIDADPGIGDAVAIALALLDPEIEVIGLTAVAGRTSGENATRNLQTLVSLIDPDRWPRIGCGDGNAVPVPKEPGTPNPLLMNGPTGLGDCESFTVGLHQRHESPKLLAELVKAEPHEITLLTLGPLTNVQLARDWHPDFLSDLKGLVCLGGSVADGGDVTAAAEFNVFADPESARDVLTSPATKTLVPRDVASRFMLSFESYDRFGLDDTTRLGRLLEHTVPFALRASRQHLGREGIELPELVAVAAISQPRLFERTSMSLDIELSGELTRGMTVFDRRDVARWQTNIDVLTAVDIQGVLDYMTRIIRTQGG